MTNKEKKEWLSVKYPLTIIRDRYDGVYSRACWLAFPLDYDEIPEDVTGDDVVCSLFWETYKEPVGKGAYANDAVIDLMERMEAPEYPEESEDERIRKEIISALMFANDGGVYDKYIAYLEKQKDLDKMIVVSPEVWSNAISEAFENGKKECEKQKEQSTKHKTYDGKALSRSYDLGYRKGVADAEKEMYNESGYTPDESRAYDHGYENGYNDGKDEVKQKPAELETLGKPMTHEEWAEDYWEHHKFASPNGNDKCDVIQFEHKGFIDFCMSYCVDQKPQDRLVLHDTFGYEKGRQVGQREGVEMVLKTPESYGLYKPAEWSKNDTVFLNEITDFFENKTVRLQHDIDMYAHWLKSLPERFNLQPKQEWGEEDEKMRWNLISAFTDKNNSKVDEFMGLRASKAEILDFLKSLRPSWKPSEDEERLINTSISFLKDFADKGYENAIECIDWLKSKLNGNACK